MSEFLSEIRGRIHAARRALDHAERESDVYDVAVRQGELESLERLVSEHEADKPAS